MEPQMTLSRRIGRFLALVGAIFAIAMAVIVTQRLSDDSLALLIGLGAGVVLMLPTLALGVLLWRRETLRQSSVQPPQPQAASPPVVVITPSMLAGQPGNGGHQPMLEQAAPWAWQNQEQAVSQRQFTIVGGEE